MKNDKMYARGVTDREAIKRVDRWSAFVKRFGQHISPGRLRKVLRGMIDDHEAQQMKNKNFHFHDRINRGGCSMLFNLKKGV